MKQPPNITRYENLSFFPYLSNRNDLNKSTHTKPFNPIVMEEIYYFEDWVNNMLNSSDYLELEIMDFKDHYQNLLSFDVNTEMFIKWYNEQPK